MPEDIQIRLVHVEFLRPGPPDNQLLSPLTPYLAISGDTGAGVVTVPYEHAEFERRLKDLRYETGWSDYTFYPSMSRLSAVSEASRLTFPGWSLGSVRAFLPPDSCAPHISRRVPLFFQEGEKLARRSRCSRRV